MASFCHRLAKSLNVPKILQLEPRVFTQLNFISMRKTVQKELVQLKRRKTDQNLPRLLLNNEN